MSSYFQAVIANSFLALAACATSPIGHKDLLSFLADGNTPKEDVYRKLGQPTSEFEESRILTYRLGQSRDGFFTGTAERGDWSIYRYSLVLVFDAKGILMRHSLVDVRKK